MQDREEPAVVAADHGVVVAATAAADEAKLKHVLSFYAGAQGDG